MSSKNVDAVRTTLEIWNKHEWTKAASAYTENATMIDHGRGITYKGRDEIVGSWDELAKGFPDIQVTDVKIHDAGDTVVTTFVGRGTNQGEMMSFPATGRRVSLPICSITHFDSKGLIERVERYSDTFSMLVQMGLTEAPPQS